MLSLLVVLEQIVIILAALCALILVHEFGHFVVAKLSKMRVDEFGLGFPPRALTLGKIGETTYTLNWLPLGGFVKIHGEDGSDVEDPRSFAARPRVLQGLVLIAGIAMNLLFAYVLIAGALVVGTPRALTQGEAARARHLHVAVASVLPNSPAAQAGLEPGDEILLARDARGTWAATSTASFSSYVAESHGTPISLVLAEATGGTGYATATPVSGLFKSDPSRYVLGVEIMTVGVAPVPLIPALKEAGTLTWGVISLTATSFVHLFVQPSLKQVRGPIGIVAYAATGGISSLGTGIAFVAEISIGLALLNLVPIPALDGGRLLIVIVEGLTRRRVSPNLLQTIVGFAFMALILLVVVVSAHDIERLWVANHLSSLSL